MRPLLGALTRKSDCLRKSILFDANCVQFKTKQSDYKYFMWVNKCFDANTHPFVILISKYPATSEGMRRGFHKITSFESGINEYAFAKMTKQRQNI